MELNIAVGEWLFPGAADEFRRRYFGADLQQPLTESETAYAASLAGAEFVLSRPIATDQAAWKAYNAVDAYLTFSTHIDSRALIERIRLRTVFQQGRALADLVAALQPHVDSALEAAKSSDVLSRLAVYDGQISVSRAAMSDALISGQLRYWQLDHLSGELRLGRPAHWRSDVATTSWQGGRMWENGRQWSALIREQDFDDYFGGGDQVAPLALSGPAEIQSKFACVKKSAWLADALGGSISDQPRRTIAEYRELARNLARSNGFEATDEEADKEGKKLRALHNRYIPKNRV